jgi:hypothetical protein
MSFAGRGNGNGRTPGRGTWNDSLPLTVLISSRDMDWSRLSEIKMYFDLLWI